MDMIKFGNQKIRNSFLKITIVFSSKIVYNINEQTIVNLSALLL